MLLQEQRHLQEIADKAQTGLTAVPEGHLRISKDKNKPRYYQCIDDNNGIYIPRSNKELPKLLAQKTYNRIVVKKAETRLKQMEKILQDYTDDEIEKIYTSMHKERKSLVTPIEPTWDELLTKWYKEEYQGKGDRLNDMVESIKEHGILTPVIVRKLGSGYEMLAGHNRHNAAKLAGLTEIPAIVKEDLTDDEAWIYVVETNVIQRSFGDLTISERIAVLSTRYNEVCGTKKREEILKELHLLNGDGGHRVHQIAKSRELIGQEYGMTGRNIARYIRCGQLIPEFRNMLDDLSLALVVGVELSYLSAEEQELVKGVLDKNCISIKMDMAKKLRAAAGTITEESVQTLMGVDKPVESAEIVKPISVKLEAKSSDPSTASNLESLKGALESVKKAKQILYQKGV